MPIDLPWALAFVIIAGLIPGLKTINYDPNSLPANLSQRPTSETTSNNADLIFSDVKLVTMGEGTAVRYFIEGKVKNTSSTPMQSPKVIYREYQQQNDQLVELETLEAKVNPTELKPGKTGIFGRRVNSPSEVILIESLVSLDREKIEVNECYADNLERREICRRQLNPRGVYSLLK
ncbi:MAG: hypothetical protein RSE13_10175 [Planktothrix sp. GU0601_MAG3]|nr:MAG: hypothetical protein RSE13_10175 [Planktothrix sp. GU0601_MAG3]